MTLNITYLSPRVIYQSGDFRLTDTNTGKPLDYWAQKQIIVSRFDWAALVAFCGAAHTGQEYVPEWIANQVASINPQGAFEELVEKLREADAWLSNFAARSRAFTISVGAFVGTSPVFVMLSNYERLDQRPQKGRIRVADKLSVTRVRPNKPRLIVTGRPAAVDLKDRYYLSARLRGDPTPVDAYQDLARINRRAAQRDGSISEGCFTSHLTIIREYGGQPHDFPKDRDYLPAFIDMHGVKLPPLKREVDEQGRPKAIQLTGVSGASFTPSEDFFKKALAEKPNDASTLSNYGNFLRARHDIGGAEAAYKAAIDADPSLASAHGNYAILLSEDRGDKSAAEREYELAVAASPSDVLQLTNFAVFKWIYQNDVEGAAELFQRALSTENNSYAQGRYAFFLERGRGDLNEAESRYLSALAASPGEPYTATKYGFFLWNVRQRPDEALSYFEQAVATEPPHVEGLLGLAAFEMIERKNYERARRLLRRALKTQPNNSTALALYAHALSKTGRREAVVEQLYRRALEIDENHAMSLANLAQVLLHRDGHDAEAVSLLTRCVEAGSDEASSLDAWFYRYGYRLHDLPQSLSAIKQLVARGVRSKGWDFSGDIEAASQSAHPNVDLVITLAAVISGEEAPSSLNRFPEWLQAG
jgi:Tfp pilus assembly protein PilF